MQSFKLIGTSRSELNTELRFILAGARVDGEDLVRLEIKQRDDVRENETLSRCVIQLLRGFKKEGIVEFYANHDSFSVNSTEAIYLLNKYGNYVSDGLTEAGFVFVKL